MLPLKIVHAGRFSFWEDHKSRGWGMRRDTVRPTIGGREPNPERKSTNMTIKPEGAAQYARRADPESSVWYLGCLFTVLADSEETGGQYGLIESLSPKGTEPPRHVHSREDETFYLLEGKITFYIGEETYEATPGTFVSAPRGVPHSYTFDTEVIRMLVLVAPGGFEEFFRPPQSSEPAQALEIPPPSDTPPDVPALVAVLEQHGVEVVGPPGPPVQG
jgi:quercetin dioxygenase-like cupin family protein